MFNSRFFDVIAIVALFSGPAASAADWSFIGGNDGGTFDRIAVSPDDSQVVYVGISGERATPTGFFRTTDGGASWTEVGAGLNVNAAVRSISIDAINPTTVYVGSSLGLYRSTDAGDNFIGILAADVQDAALDPIAASTIYATTFDTVLKTTDGGTSWADANTGLSGSDFRNLLVDPTDPDVVYVVNGSNLLFRSSDGGQNWSPQAGTGLAVTNRIDTVHMDPTTPSTLYLVADSDSIFRSDDSGATWTDISIAGQFGFSLAIDPAMSTVLYACTQEFLYRSVNGGDDWAFYSEVISNAGIPNPGQTGCSTLRVSNDPQTMYAAGGGGIIRSADNGVTWAGRNSGLAGAEVNQVALDPSTPERLYSAAESGAFVSNDSGASWSKLGVPGLVRFRQLWVDPNSSDTLYALRDNNMITSVDGGTSWTELQLGMTGFSPQFMAIAPTTPTTLYYAVDGDGVYRSLDGGDNWTQVVNGLTDLSVRDLLVDPVEPQTLYVATSNGGFFRSADAGDQWNAINNGIAVGVNGIFGHRLRVDPNDNAVLYASANSALYVSTNSGGQWNELDTSDISVSPFTIVNMIAVQGPNAESVLYVNGPFPDVWKSNDGGLNWFPFSGGLTGFAFNSNGNNAFAGDTTFGSPVYLATSRGVFESVPDFDGDGVPDLDDQFPTDPFESVDTDGDGIGNNADTDDDNDGVPDAFDTWPTGRFLDVDPASHFAFTFIEALERSGVTGGCGGNNYCPDNPVTRAQMAVFLERGINGSMFVPPPANGTVFADVGASDFAAAYIEQLAADGITGGCGGGNYCPTNSVTRAQMAVFLLRARYGSTYVPPPPTGIFNDVPVGSFADGFIEQLAAEGITGGCGNGNFCPDNPITRAQMAVFLVRTFGL
jgi:photosystem II stability/assembly factor-like uncharacterized protein